MTARSFEEGIAVEEDSSHTQMLPVVGVVVDMHLEELESRGMERRVGLAVLGSYIAAGF